MITANADKSQPFSQWEEVDVVFTGANTDQAITHNLVPPSPEHINYIPIRLGQACQIYHDTTGTRTPWQSNYIILRSTVAGAKATLLLYVSRGRRTLPF